MKFVILCCATLAIFHGASWANPAGPPGEAPTGDEIDAQRRKTIDRCVIAAKEAIDQYVQVLGEHAGDVSEKLNNEISDSQFSSNTYIDRLIKAIGDNNSEETSKIAKFVLEEITRCLAADVKNFQETAAARTTSTEQEDRIANITKHLSTRLAEEFAPLISMIDKLTSPGTVQG